ncbi:hypothetical protein T492DRAFT_947566 [Pavlovales sp. CCMP2436]|nr:hypothetical protein T492DRAFT_947566 [Pavlovales sp. CCMP2436]
MSIADRELSRIERDYLATINATLIQHALPEAPVDAGDAGYQMLGDDGTSDLGSDDGGERGGAGGDVERLGPDDSLAPAAAACQPMVDDKDDSLAAAAGKAMAVDAAAPTSASAPTPAAAGAEDAAQPRGRDIAITDDSKALITGLMSGFQLGGAGEWASSFSERARKPRVAS